MENMQNFIQKEENGIVKEERDCISKTSIMKKGLT